MYAAGPFGLKPKRKLGGKGAPKGNSTLPQCTGNPVGSGLRLQHQTLSQDAEGIFPTLQASRSQGPKEFQQSPQRSITVNPKP